MRSVSVEELELHTSELVAEVESGQRLTILRGGKVVANMEPVLSYPDVTEAEREEARQRLFEMMEKGADLKGLRINRDELYDEIVG